ncbi:hypothetical protein ACS4JF_20225 [Bacillus thuringiensis]|uniref:hypothetical protein n=1 Tax=Bacillus TaxID=1386 RepID=UPI000992688E|nr:MULTISPECIES: hypothetical protein [Bacillus cereus group]MEC2866338.1 hypothetical protein [Bacillus cereus]MDM8365576.1 hypothetical protein [Bacillus thuringiensis]OOR59304.1 hypothetical protein BLX04_24440 [Bacillus mycoides]OTZ80306.1 hypothetical protein BK768_05425 [Bacillus thuringiensis serovar tohokuensis]OUB84860.1 hypothetical protein BK773_23570 [Bacillus thuringiensis serovar indiana]
MKKTREVYVCERCENVCESTDCYLCDAVSARKIPMEIDTKTMMQGVREVLALIESKQISIMLSRCFDAPSDLVVVNMAKETILEDLNKIDFVFNDVTAVKYKGFMRECLGIGLLDPYKTVEGEQVTGLFIFTE